MALRRLRFILVFLGTLTLRFSSLADTIGLELLRQTQPELRGQGITVAQPEAGGRVEWQINPASVGQPVSLFVYESPDGSTNAYPNSLGSESAHANAVGGFFYGPSWLAPGVDRVYSHPAIFFYDSIVGGDSNISARVVNQSFIFNSPFSEQLTYFDNYAAKHNVLFVSAVGNGGAVSSPGIAYNSIGVGAFGGASSTGPTADARSKPDLTAPATMTSFSTPLVAGSAALLMQAAQRGDGGVDTNSAGDIRTIKALLLNSAIKPAGWTNSPTRPLDARFGAGVLNVFNAHHQLAGGQLTFNETTTNPVGEPHPAGTNLTSQELTTGWAFNTIASSLLEDGINHYYFVVSNEWRAPSTLTATLTWHRRESSPLVNDVSLNNLDLFLLNADSGELIASSVSGVDNVEHLYLPKLPPGRYDLQVLKNGGLLQASNLETYALALETFAIPLQTSLGAGQIILSWPVAPDGFVLESSLTAGNEASWSPVSATPAITNGLKVVTLSPTNIAFFRLRRP